jgi:hypothetical protein
MESPANLAAALGERLNPSNVCAVPSPKRRPSRPSTQEVTNFLALLTAPDEGGKYMGGPVGAILPPRASLFGVRSLSLVLADFGTLVFFVLLFIFILSFLFCFSLQST